MKYLGVLRSGGPVAAVAAGAQDLCSQPSARLEFPINALLRRARVPGLKPRVLKCNIRLLSGTFPHRALPTRDSPACNPRTGVESIHIGQNGSPRELVGRSYAVSSEALKCLGHYFRNSRSA